MKRLTLPLSKYTYAQKLDLLETLWGNLAKDEGTFQSPDWHKAILEDRQQELAFGNIKTTDWQEAKARIKRKVACR